MLNKVCGEGELIKAAGAYGRTAKVPSVWFYSRNDSYFGPELARRMEAAFAKSGAPASLHILPAYGAEGHEIASDEAGWDLWGNDLDSFLASTTAVANADRAIEHQHPVTAQSSPTLSGPGQGEHHERVSEAHAGN
jgi:dienelactone hydrolase